MTQLSNNNLAACSLTRLLNAVREAENKAERDDNRSDHSFYRALTLALTELQERRSAAEAQESVPDEMLSAMEEVLRISDRDHDAWRKAKAGIVACRAAILHGKSEPVSQPYTLPQWIPCSERMPEETGRYWCYVEEQNDLGKSHYQWNCSWNGNRWWVESENGGRVTHWMPLPAAPQEPTK